MKKQYTLLLLVSSFVFNITASAQRVHICATGSGDWANSSIWSLKRTPSHNDSIIIPAGKKITISGSQSLTNSILKIYGTLIIDEATDDGNSINLDIRTLTNQPAENIIKLMSGNAAIRPGINGSGIGRIRIQVNSRGNFFVKYTTGNSIVTGPAIAYNNTGEAFIQQAEATLPVILVDFFISNSEKIVNLKWKTQQENNNESYIVERSTDGIVWNMIAEIKAIVYSNMPQYYSYTDESPVTGINYYRIRILDRDGNYGITRVKAARISAIGNKAGIYPNPAISTATVFVNDMEARYLYVNIYDREGKFVTRYYFAEGSNIITMDVSKLSHGDYSAEAVSSTGSRQMLRFMVARK